MKSIFIFFALLCGCVCTKAQQKASAYLNPLTIVAKPLQDTVDAGKPMSVAFTLTNNSDDTLTLEYKKNYNYPNYTDYDAPLTPALPLVLLPKQVFKTVGTEIETGYNGNSTRNIYIRYHLYKNVKSYSPYGNAGTAQFTYYTKNSRFNKIEFAYIIADRQNIPNGGDGYFIYPFKNTGNEPLIISSAKGSCGCLVPTYPKEPILPNEWAMIEARYDTRRTGPFTKTVTVSCNDKNKETILLTVKGSVEAPKTSDTVRINSAVLVPKPSADTPKTKQDVSQSQFKFYHKTIEKGVLTQNTPCTFYFVYEDATRADETLSVLSQSPEISAVRFRKHVLKIGSSYNTNTQKLVSIIEIDYNTQKIGVFDSNIVLKTSDPTCPTVRLALKGLVLGAETSVSAKK